MQDVYLLYIMRVGVFGDAIGQRRETEVGPRSKGLGYEKRRNMQG